MVFFLKVYLQFHLKENSYVVSEEQSYLSFQLGKEIHCALVDCYRTKSSSLDVFNTILLKKAVFSKSYNSHGTYTINLQKKEKTKTIQQRELLQQLP